MGVFTAVDEGAVAEALADRGLGSLRALRGVPAGSVNSNFQVDSTAGTFFLRVYEEQDGAGARREAALLSHLRGQGVPTPAPIATAGRDAVFALSGKPAAFFPWCEGRPRCQASVAEADVLAVGGALARVHLAGAGLSVGPGRFRVEDLLERTVRIAAAEDPILAAQAPLLSERLAAWTARRDPSVPRGVIHGDLFRDNVLWSAGGELVALLDFESASEGPFAYDVMVTVLSWCFGDDLDLGLARALVAGYRRVRDLSEVERAALLGEGIIAALRFTVTRITDYAMREALGPRVLKDWRRFDARRARLEAMVEGGLRRALDL